MLINTGSAGGIALGIGVTALALGVTYLGFTAAHPETFPGSNDLRKSIGVEPPQTTQPTLSTNNVVVPDVVTKPYAEAVQALVDAGLTVERKDVALDENEQGVVVAQDPGAGESVEKGNTVELSVTPLAVPDVRGQTEGDARSHLDALAFSVETSTEDVTDASLDGVVIEQSPVSTMAAPGTTVVLTIGKVSQ